MLSLERLCYIIEYRYILYLDTSSIAASRASKDGSGTSHMLFSSTASMAVLIASRTCVSYMFFSPSSTVSIAVLVASGSWRSIFDQVLKHAGEHGPFIYTLPNVSHKPLVSQTLHN